MALKAFKIRVKSDKGVENCLDDLWLNSVSAKMTLEEKIEQLFEQFREPIFRYLVVTFGSRAEAEDITQEAFIKLYHAFKEGKQIENLKAWLYRVAHNLALNQIRNQQFISPLGEMEWAEIAEFLPDLDTNPEEKLLKLERRERLHNAMKILTAQERQCLHLRAAGFRYREIAEIMNIGIPTVGEYLKRGINKITK
jgi:RNA polymerase sigma-70 factor (ECF subfamily)